ncbi:MAG TPA: hypothetical protein VFZ65_01075 [Planctomycetota bacterium]|nr:hypothetical protein [Planctomycetota bacterium]
MKHRPSERPDDATLVAWLDRELPAADAAVVARHVTDDADLAERVDLLRASRAELAWALDENTSTPPPSTPVLWSARRNRALSHRDRWHVGLWLLAAAALSIVVTIGYRRGDDRAEADENDLLSVRLTTPRAGWDLFSGIRFAIEGRAKTATPCRIVSREKDENDEQLAARALAENGGEPIVPMVLDAELTCPGRRVLGRVAGVDGRFASEPTSVAVELVDLRMPHDGIAPLLNVRLDTDGAREDFLWGFTHGVAPANSDSCGFVPEQTGEYRLRLRLRALPTGAGSPPAFVTPLDIAVGFAVRGRVGEWSEPVDGMRARIVAGQGPGAAGRPFGVALQLRNDSDRDRKFNLTGVTMAKIPQPFHFDLVVDGRSCRQRDDLGVIISAGSSFLPQPIGTVRSAIVLTDYWLADGKPLSELRETHQVSIRFHFEPTLWSDSDKSIWMGQIDTPPITIDFGGR